MKYGFLIAAILLFVSFNVIAQKSHVLGQNSCALQTFGDINCDGKIDLIDYEIWRKGYLGILTPSPTVAATSPTPTPTTTITVSITPSPTQTQNTSWWKPTPNTPIHWHWQLTDNFQYPRDVLPNKTVYDIDGEYATADTVARLHALGPDVKVICYFDAGVYENYRSDANRFPQSVIGKADAGWAGSYWLDTRQTSILLPIMRDRITNWCKNKGFDAIEPDETENQDRGNQNITGFDIPLDATINYNKQIAAIAHELGLSAGLKGNTTETGQLWQDFDWTLNEQCFEYNECDNIVNSFIAHGKAAFNIEYNTNPDCTYANNSHMNSARRDLDLVGPTNSSYLYKPCEPDTKNTW